MAGPILSFLGSGIASSLSGMFNPATSTVSYTTNALMPVVMPDLSELVGAFVSNEISSATLSEFGLIHGRQYVNLGDLFRYTRTIDGVVDLDNEAVDRPRPINSKVLQQYRYLPSINECQLMLNRGLISEQLFGYIVGKQTVYNPELAGAFAQLRYEIPGPADLVRFAVRDVFSPEVVRQFEYAKETPTTIKPWMDKQGYGQNIGVALPDNATDASGRPIGGDATWFDLYWQSHWDLPSPTQGYEMMHRLYTESDYGPSPFVTENTAFSESDLALLLKASDYPAYWRERLMAISYHNLNRSDVVPMYERGLVTEREVYHALRADGYRDEEAKVLLRLANFKKDRYVGLDISKQTKEHICKLYSSGFLNRDVALQRLKDIGASDTAADQFLIQCDLESQWKLLEERIKTLKRGYITGVVTEDGARNLLNGMNLNSDRIEIYLNIWQHLKFSRYKTNTTKQNISAYEMGLINYDELVARLQNLGYTASAISTMTRSADYKINSKRLAMLQKQAREDAKLQKQILADQRKKQKEALAAEKKRESNIEKVNNKRIRKIIKASSDKNILDWYKKEFIELWELYYRLYYKDYTIADAAKWVKAKVPDLDNEEYYNAETKATRIYRSEPNPPLT